VPPEAKIRQLCTRLLAAENDEASKRILHELREALHKNYEGLGEKWREKWSGNIASRKTTWPQTEAFYFLPVLF
jgi:hypothetical protein